MKKIKSAYLYIAVFSLIGLLLIVGMTYAVISWRSAGSVITLDSNCFEINFSKGQDIAGQLSIIDESDYIDEDTFTMDSSMLFSTISIELDEDCTNIAAFATLEVNVTNIPNELTPSGNSYGLLKYVVLEYDPEDYVSVTSSTLDGEEFTILASGIISSSGRTDIHTELIASGDKKDYIVVFYADQNLLVHGLLYQLSIAGTVDARVEQISEENEMIDEFYYITSDDNIILIKYNGTNPIVNVPATMMVDGIEYNTVIFEKVFKNNTYIEEVYFGDGVSVQRGDAKELFYGCTNLRKVENLPSNITNMYYTFSGCTSLVTAPEIPNGVISLDSAFNACEHLVNTPVIPSSVRNMTYTFHNCTSLVNAPEIPYGVLYLYYAFDGCTSLASAPEIPNSVTNMQGAFTGCTSLVEAPVIPNSVTTIASAFAGCSSLTSVQNYGNSVTSMLHTFYNCTSLVSVPDIIPDTVVNMGETFEGCYNLVTGPSVIGNSVGNMYRAFKGCSKLRGTIQINSSSVVLRDSSNVIVGGSANHPFYGIQYSVTVRVPSGSTTHTTMITSKPSNLTVQTFTS